MTVWWCVTLAAWLCISFALLVYTGEEKLLALAVALMAFVVVTGMTRPRWAIAGFLLSAILFSGLWLWIERDTGNPASVLAAVTAFGGAAWLGRVVYGQVRELYRMVRSLRRRIQEMSIKEEATGALRLEPGRELIDEADAALEFARSAKLGIAIPE